MHNPLHNVNLLSTVSHSPFNIFFSWLTCVTHSYSFIVLSCHATPRDYGLIFRLGASQTSELRTSVRTSLSERWVVLTMLVSWQCLVTHLVIFIHLSVAWTQWRPTEIFILQYTLMPMQQNIFSFILDKLSFFSVKGLMLFGFYLHRDIKYCRKVIHRCTFTSYSLHQLYWLWFALGFVIKRNKLTNKQLTTVFQY